MSGKKLLALAALALLAGTAWAQDEAACDPAALSDLRSQLEASTAKLQDVSSQLEAAQASSSSCSSEAAGLKDKLQQAEDSLATNAAALKELESKLASAPDAGALDKERAELQAAADAAKAEAEAARSDAGSCATKHATCEGSLKAAADEAAAKVAAAESSQAGLAQQLEGLKAELARVRAEAEAARSSLAQLESAWLPRWAEQATRQAAAKVGPALEQAKQYAAQGTQAAQALWQTRGKPAVNQGLALARSKSAQLNAAIEARAGDSWPKVKAAAAGAAAAAAKHGSAAWQASRKAALQAWHSPALAAVRPALAKCYAQAAQQAAKVQNELEELLISLLSKNNSTVPLARRPYVTYLVYAALVVPLVAFGLPLLGLRGAPKPRVGENGPGSTPSSARKKKRTTRAH
ncbi:hypothetical protein ABPG75_003618 [Micractinium tetrahymenae]